MKEKALYPRSIIIFKSYTKDSFTIKSFEIYLDNHKEEKYKQIYVVEDLLNIADLIKELNEIIYGKDLINYTNKKYYNYFDK
ncbi:MAG: hypothetical protein EU529_01680 [Promethearchaeota archaeon]|nr:MAG: hypothetical protein EU529_01680 [Candidatus Lokiarchaeota archaeon]